MRDGTTTSAADAAADAVFVVVVVDGSVDHPRERIVRIRSIRRRYAPSSILVH